MKTKFVKDVKEDWRDMDGDTLLERWLNAYLTYRFTLSKDMPSDECLSEARTIIKVIRSGKFGDIDD